MEAQELDLNELVRRFLQSSEIEVDEGGSGARHSVEVNADSVSFSTGGRQVIYRGCRHMAEAQTMQFLGDLFLLEEQVRKVGEESECPGSVTSHELKNMLGAARLSLEMLTAYDFDEADRRKLLLQAFEAVNQSVSVFEEMLQLERLRYERKRGTIRVEAFRPAEMVANVLQTLAAQAELKGVKVVFDNEADAMLVDGSLFWVERAVYNLVSNAIKYNVRGGSVTVTLRDGGGTMELSVGDDGIGIDAAEREKVFEKFHTADATRGQGTGLGLALVKAVVDAHHGTIRFESAVGEGTTFSVTLPKKAPRREISHPMALLSAAAVLLAVGISYFFPVIPTFDTVGRSGLFETVRLDDGSVIKVQKGADYAFWHLENLTGSKRYLRLSLDRGRAEADLKGSRVAFSTPAADFVNLGTQLSIRQQTGTGSVSVFKGALRSEEQTVESGYGFAGNEGNIRVARLLDPPYGITSDNLDDGRMSVTFGAVRKAASYELMLARDDAFTDVIKLEEVPQPGAVFDIREDGYYYVKISAIDPDGIEGFPNTAVIKNMYHLRAGIAARERGDGATAASLLETSAEEFGRKEYLPYSELGWTYYLQGDYAAAVRSFDKAIALNPTSRDLVRQARCFFHLKEYGRAGGIYDGVLAKEPYNLDALWGEAEVRLAEHEPKAAEKLLTELLRLDPAYPLGQYDMARVRLTQHRRKEALRHLEVEMKYNTANRQIVRELYDSIAKEPQK